MNEEQKRFTVEKVEKYNELQGQKNIVKQALWAAFHAIATYGWVSGATNPELIPGIPSWVFVIGGVVTSVAFLGRVKSIITSIVKKAGLENMVEQLNHQLEVEDLGSKEESGPTL